MKDIENQDDLYYLVDNFYKRLLSDASISYIFTDVVKIKLEEHLPILVTFWSQAIFDTGGYFNNLTKIHLDINEKENLTPELFTIWLNHFNDSVDDNFVGTNAEKIKTQALSLATIMQIKINIDTSKIQIIINSIEYLNSIYNIFTFTIIENVEPNITNNIAFLSHELRNPLQTINLASMLLNKTDLIPDNQQKYIKMI